jgi:hypothetical protein
MKMTHTKLNSETILKSATERIQHFRESLFSIESLLSEDKPYQDIFCAVVERINLASGLNKQDQLKRMTKYLSPLKIMTIF